MGLNPWIEISQRVPPVKRYALMGMVLCLFKYRLLMRLMNLKKQYLHFQNAFVYNFAIKTESLNWSANTRTFVQTASRSELRFLPAV